MNMEVFSLGHSFLHRLDPRVKVIVAFLFSIIVAVLDLWPPIYMALVFAVSMAVLGRLNPPRLFKRLAVVNGFVLMLWLILPFTTPGDESFRIGPFIATDPGVHMCLLITAKSNAIVLAVIALLGTSPTFHVVHALHHLRVPDKLVHLLFFTVRYIDVLSREYGRLRAAMKVRGFVPATNLHTYRAFANLIAMLLIRSYDRAERVFQAMLCRGFAGTFRILNHFTLTGRDVAALVVLVCACLGIGLLEACCQ